MTTHHRPSTLTQGDLLSRIMGRIRQSLELQEILDATTVEMRSFLQTDRVKVYRFQPDGTGQVIAESLDADRLPSLLGLHFPASDIPLHAREMFIKARQRVIVDIPSQQIILSSPDCPETTGDLSLEDLDTQPISEIVQRPVDPCHVAYLTAMGVQSSLVVPILHNRVLWGLLVSHHAEPRNFSAQELEIVQMLSDQVSLAIGQSHLLSRAREKARRESLINRISTLLHSPLQVQQILQIVLEQVVNAVQGSGGRLYLKAADLNTRDELYTCGAQPVKAESGLLLEQHLFWQRLMQAHEATQPANPISEDWIESLLNSESLTDFIPLLQVIIDLYQYPELEETAPLFRPTRIRNLLMMPLHYRGQALGCLTIFRNEIDTDILWAGRFDPDERQERVRDSFAAWRELKLGQAPQWTTDEVELIRSLGTHLTMTVMQNRLYQCEREQRLLVEMRNLELNTARTVAEEASRLKSDFLSSTSHELRTPLSSTLNYLKLLKEGLYDNEEELKEYIDIAHHSAENLVAILNDVLDIAKIEAGRMNVNWEAINLRSLLDEQQRLFHLDSRRKGLPLLIECEVEQVYADKVKLRQILTNLISNAFKFTSTGSIQVRVTSKQEKIEEEIAESLIEFSVRDTGIGIDLNNRETLFEPFVQADGSIKRRYGGTGLGLTVCKRLVELMGGQIWLSSAGKGQGTTMTFTLPDRIA